MIQVTVTTQIIQTCSWVCRSPANNVVLNSDNTGQSADTCSASVVQMKEAADFREVKLKGKNHILKTGHYRLKNELKSDHKKVEQLQEQVFLLCTEEACSAFALLAPFEPT